MLSITVPDSEYYDESTNRFSYVKGQHLSLEHSLVSISKWESKWHKPFLATKDKTEEETRDYIRCMTLTQNVNPILYLALSEENINKITEYINDSMTATWFPERKGGQSREVITSEIIYYWMISYNVPMECQKWHLNRLLTLIRVCEAKSQKPKKMRKGEVLARNRELNEARKKALGTTG